MNNFNTRKISHKKNSIGDYILFAIMIAVITLGTLYAFGEEQRIADERGVAVNQIR